MKLTFLTGVFFLMMLTNESNAQTPRTYVRIVVQGANTIDASQEIDLLIRSKEGVLISRMDRRTGLYLGVFESNSGISSDDFVAWIEELGYTTKCRVEGGHGTGEPIKELSREACSNELFGSE